MTRKVIALVMVFMLLAGINAASAQTAVAIKGVNMRDGIGGPVLTVVPAGAAVSIITDYGQHVLCTYGGFTGVIFKQYLSIDGKQGYVPTEKKDYYLHAKDTVEVYEEASTTSLVVATLEKDTAVKIIPIDSDRWYKVYVDGIIGYALREEFYGSRRDEQSDEDWLSFEYSSKCAVIAHEVSVNTHDGTTLEFKPGDVFQVMSVDSDNVKISLDDGNYARIKKAYIVNGDVYFPMDVYAVRNLVVRETASVTANPTGVTLQAGDIVTAVAAFKTGNGWMLELVDDGFIYAGYTRPLN